MGSDGDVDTKRIFANTTFGLPAGNTLVGGTASKLALLPVKVVDGVSVILISNKIFKQG